MFNMLKMSEKLDEQIKHKFQNLKKACYEMSYTPKLYFEI